jgi:hypothetical protein
MSTAMPALRRLAVFSFLRGGDEKGKGVKGIK